MKFSASLKNTQQFERALNQEVISRVSKAVKSAMPEIETTIKFLFRKNLVESDEWRSLLNGELQKQLGLTDSESRLEALLKIWLDGVMTSYTPSTGKLQVSMVPSSFADVILSPAASFETENGATLDWLEWLLMEGDKTIVRDYHIQYNPVFSRTESYVMIKGGGWSIPADMSGTMNDNFVTRAIENIPEEAMSQAIKSSVGKYLR